MTMLKKYLVFTCNFSTVYFFMFSRAVSKPGVHFTNILWAAFAPKSFWQTITNPNCKHLKTVQRTLVWLSFSPIFTSSFFIPMFFAHLLCAYKLGLLFFGERILTQKLLIKSWWNWHQGSVFFNFFSHYH